MNYLHELQTALAGIDAGQVSRLSEMVRGCSGTIWLAGNGGSHANALHWACDLSKAAGRRAQALGANGAVLTAWANDTSFDMALSQELMTLGRPDDCLICLSCSGRSKNIVTLLREAWLMKMPRALLTGAEWLGVTPVEVVVNVPHAHYGIIEDCHMAIGHWLTEDVR